MTILRAIPGERPGLHRIPADAPSLALADMAALAASVTAARVFGLAEPIPLYMTWDDRRGILTTTVDILIDPAEPAMPRSDGPGNYRCLEWRWGVLEEREDWYQVGWHKTCHNSGHGWTRHIARALNTRHYRA